MTSRTCPDCGGQLPAVMACARCGATGAADMARHRRGLLDRVVDLEAPLLVVPEPWTGAHQAVDAPREGRVEWAVELEVIGYAWAHAWRGYAVDSTDATRLAREDFYGTDPDRVAELGAKYPVRVRSCTQAGV